MTSIRMGIVAGVAGIMASTAGAVDYYWDGGTAAFKQWSSNENWVGGTTPANDAATRIFLTNRVNTGSSGGALTNDVASPLTLNYLGILTSTNTGSETAFLVAGSALHFTTNGATQPMLLSTRKATSILYTPIEIAATALTFRAGTFAVEFRGTVSGDATLFYDGPVGGAGGLTLSASNTYSGGTIYKNRASTTNTTWSQFVINASGALGSGPVELYGGNREVLTNYTAGGNYGSERTSGIQFRNSTVHANDFEIRQDAPIFVGTHGSTGSAATVTLSGAIDLNSNGLWLRGPLVGTGTVNGAISSTGGGGHLVKLDPGTWILNGNSTHTGPTEIWMGRLDINGTFDSTGLITVGPGATLGGTGTVGDVTVDDGRFAPGASPGVMTVGSLSMTGGVFAVDLWGAGGAGAANGHDQAAIDGGALSLLSAPSIEIDLNGAFDPAVAASFVVVSGFSSIGGSFDTTVDVVNAPGTWGSSGKSFEIDYGANTVSVVVVPEPSTLGILGMAAGVLVLRRRLRT
jgi:autotransporter-associated beta strand protein